MCGGKSRLRTPGSASAAPAEATRHRSTAATSNARPRNARRQSCPGSKADTWHLGRHPKVLGLAFKPEVKRQQRINWRVRYIEGDLTAGETAMLQNDLTEPLVLLTPEEKAEWLKTLDGVCLASDGFIPFRDNIDHAQKHGVKFIAQPGGSSRDDEVTAACEEYGITMVHTALRLFHH